METVAFIFSFNRPNYLKQVIQSLEKQTDRDLDYVLIQDGAVNKFSKRPYAAPQHIVQCIDMFGAAKLPNKQKIVSRWNVGMAHQKLTAYTYAFKHHDYDACLVFEDDLVVAPNYVRIMKILLRQFRDVPVISTVQASDSPDEPGNAFLNDVRFAWRHFWGYGTWADRWLKQEVFYMQYFTLVKNVDYRMRPHKAIRDLIKIKQSSHDGALDWTIKKTGMKKLITSVSRATYIGKKGLHCTPGLFDSSGYGKRLNRRIEFETDSFIENFNLVH